MPPFNASIIPFRLTLCKHFLSIKEVTHSERARGRTLSDKEIAGRWAIVVLHEHLPSRSEQVARARAWGLPSIWRGNLDDSAIIQDDVRNLPRTTKWTGRFPVRDEWLARMRVLCAPNQVAFFSTPLCVGFGRAHAAQTMQEFWEIGLQVYVHSAGSAGALYSYGDDLTEFLDAVASEANSAYQRAFIRRADDVEKEAKKEARRLRRLAKNL
jgi:hypothetical protein